MSRPLRISYPGALYHITARGNEKNLIYREKGDYRKFLKILSALPKRFSIVIYGYVLMGNHYHLLIETPKGNITKVMHYLNTAYTGYFNRKYHRVGHLFQGRYQGLLIEKDRYLLSVSRYIHLNPVRALIVKRPEEFNWSSYLQYIGKREREEWLSCSWILRRYSEDELKARRSYQSFVEEGLTLKKNPFHNLKSEPIVGSESFIEETKRKIKLKKQREIPESKRLAKRIKYEGVMVILTKRFGISEQKIRGAGRRDNLPKKICLYLLRKCTDISNEEIGRYFGIGYTAVSQAASRLKREIEKDRGLKKMVYDIEIELLSEE